MEDSEEPMAVWSMVYEFSLFHLKAEEKIICLF
jgi:hypothetical protein